MNTDLCRFDRNNILCSRCGKSIPILWSNDANYIRLEIGLGSSLPEVLFGEEEILFLNHPAIKKGSNYQKCFIYSGTDNEYKLCWHCHKKFVRLIGRFLSHNIKTMEK